jgi:hypothetical protein
MADELGDELPAEEPKYDQDFFIALALKGKDAWNAWRRDPVNEDLSVTFAAVDFSAPRDKIDFSGFEFGDAANFLDCKWRGIKWAEIENDLKAFKPGRASFANTVFGKGCKFEGAILGDCANFEGAVFGDIASVLSQTFESDCSQHIPQSCETRSQYGRTSNTLKLD